MGLLKHGVMDTKTLLNLAEELLNDSHKVIKLLSEKVRMQSEEIEELKEQLLVLEISLKHEKQS